MLVEVDHSSRVALAEQIAASVRRALAEGKLRKGERLPSARALAQALEVNMHTVLRGYQILREEKLIDLRPGRGAVVSAATANRAVAVEACRYFVRLARESGFSDAEILGMVEETME
ncbi:GntR family transcriptional regulator [Streptomyces sp. TRM 70361]|uniref:GntR family transcriptional regulator n=1 Tax=Streptomyces sp. TRM 70361 TaxID=3116553 RepID=UPI002E7B4930|nr:GntR family transcriptional regulator [Streptomyces sp. TRM 70361]MEE1942651.1 GntR family transcriptional regulator [Streptomyces sp. TRM 70361]